MRLIGLGSAVAFLALCPFEASSSSSNPLLPPFNANDSRLVAACARRAQQKQRQNELTGSGGRIAGWTLWAKFGLAPAASGTLEQADQIVPLSGLPIRQVRYEHVHRKGTLFCRTGNWLEIAGDGQVRGNRRHSGQFTIFEFLAVAFGLVSIRAVSSQNFLCMDSHGQLYTAPESQYSAECVFMEEMHPQVYNLYSSCAHGHPKRPWFVALSKTGKPRRGRNTRRRQKSAHFVLVEGEEVEAEKRGGGGQSGSQLLDSLGHAQSRADWLVHWKNFYEVHERRMRKRKKAKERSNKPEEKMAHGGTTALASIEEKRQKGRPNNLSSNRLRWEIQPRTRRSRNIINIDQGR